MPNLKFLKSYKKKEGKVLKKRRKRGVLKQQEIWKGARLVKDED